MFLSIQKVQDVTVIIWLIVVIRFRGRRGGLIWYTLWTFLRWQRFSTAAIARWWFIFRFWSLPWSKCYFSRLTFLLLLPRIFSLFRWLLILLCFRSPSCLLLIGFGLCCHFGILLLKRFTFILNDCCRHCWSWFLATVTFDYHYLRRWNFWLFIIRLLARLLDSTTSSVSTFLFHLVAYPFPLCPYRLNVWMLLLLHHLSPRCNLLVNPLLLLN